MKKKIFNILRIFCITLIMFPEVLPFVKLMPTKANENTAIINGLDADGNVSLELGESREISITDEGYVINYCGASNGGVTTVVEGNKCILTAVYPNKSYINIGMENLSTPGMPEYYKSINVFSGTDTYAAEALALIEDSYEMTTQEYNEFVNNLSYSSPINTYYSINYSNIQWDYENKSVSLEITAGLSNVYPEQISKSKRITINFTGIDVRNYRSAPYEIGTTSQLDLKYLPNSMGDSVGNLGNYFFYSSDSDIVSVDQVGKIKANGLGTANIVVIDKENNQATNLEIIVQEHISSDIEGLRSVLNTTHDIDVSLLPYDADIYDAPNCDQDGCRIGDLRYFNLFYEYFNPIIENYVAIFNGFYNYDFDENTPKGIDFTISYGDYSEWGGYSTKQVDLSTSFNVKGLFLDIYDNYQFKKRVGDTFTFDNFLAQYSDLGETPTYIVDQEYLTENNGEFTAIKHGVTNVTVFTSNYSQVVPLVIKINNTDDMAIDNYLKNVVVNLPYSANNFSTNLKGLEKVVAEYIKNNIPSEYSYLKEYYNAKVSCVNPYYCGIQTSFKTNNEMIADYNNVFISIDYQDLDANKTAYNTIKNEIDSIDSVYDYNFEETVEALHTAAGDKDAFYNTLIDASGINTIIDSSAYMIDITNIKKSNLTSDIVGSIKFTVTGREDISSPVIYSKDVEIKSFPILEGLPYSVKTPELKIAALKEKMVEVLPSLTEDEITITNVKDDIYEVSYNEISYHLFIDVKKEIKAYSLNLPSYMVVPVNTPTQIEINYFPETSNTFPPITFTSSDPTIATVDSHGVVTTLKTGYTIIKAKMGFYESNVLVLCNKNIESILNEEIVKFPTKYEVTPYDIEIGEVIMALEDQANRFNYENVVSKIGYSVYAEVNYNSANKKYYMNLNYISYGMVQPEEHVSNSIEISYDIKGISLEEYSYNISLNQAVDTKLSFTEGLNSNLYYRITNPTIVTYDLTGKLVGKKVGYTEVNIYDKLGKYYASFDVTVDKDSYNNSILDQLEMDQVDVDAGRLSGLNDMELNTGFNMAIIEIADVFSIATEGVEMNCNYSNLTCHMAFNYLDASNQELSFERDYDIRLIGIKIQNEEISKDYSAIDIDEVYTPNVSIYPTTDSYTMVSNQPNICTVDNDNHTIKGISQGLCLISYQSASGYKAIQKIFVNFEGVIDHYQEYINDIPDTLTIGLDEFDNNLAMDSYMYPEKYMYTISEAINTSLGINDNNIRWSINFESLEADSKIEINMSACINAMENSTKTIYGECLYYDEQNGEIFTPKEVTLIFDPIVFDKQAELDAILDQIEPVYELNVEQAIRYKMGGGFLGNYSSFIDLFEDTPFTVRYEANRGGADEFMSGDAGTYFIFYNDTVVALGDVEFVLYQSTTDLTPKTQEQTIAELKEIVLDTYKSIKAEEQSQLNFAVDRSVFSRRNIATFTEPEIPITITYAGIGFNNTDSYNVEIDNLRFNLSLARATTGNESYVKAPSYTIGDLNADGAITLTDLTQMRKHMAGVRTLTGNALLAMDINSDGDVTLTDLTRMRKHLAGIQLFT